MRALLYSLLVATAALVVAPNKCEANWRNRYYSSYYYPYSTYYYPSSSYYYDPGYTSYYYSPMYTPGYTSFYYSPY